LRPAEEPVTEFPFVHRERVRFSDRDALGHVNNAVYSTYLEEARIDILGGLTDFILARVEIDFRSELRDADEVVVRSRLDRIGTTSFTLRHEIHAAGQLVAEATSVIVAYDYARGQTDEVSDELRERLEAR